MCLLNIPSLLCLPRHMQAKERTSDHTWTQHLATAVGSICTVLKGLKHSHFPLLGTRNRKNELQDYADSPSRHRCPRLDRLRMHGLIAPVSRDFYSRFPLPISAVN